MTKNLLMRFAAAAATVSACLAFLPAAAQADVIVQVRTETGYPGQDVTAGWTATGPGGTRSGTGRTSGKGELAIPASPGDHITVKAPVLTDTLENSCPGVKHPDPLQSRLEGDVAADGQQFSLPLPRFITEMTGPGISAEEQKFLALANQERAKLGKPLLAASEPASAAADAQATWLDISGDLSHSRRFCEDPRLDVLEAGGQVMNPDAPSFNPSSWKGEDYYAHAEVINEGEDTAAGALNLFRTSPNHWFGLVEDEQSTCAGVANVGIHWVVMLFSRCPGTAGPVPSRPRVTPGKGQRQPDPPAQFTLKAPAVKDAGATTTVYGTAPAGTAVKITAAQGKQAAVITRTAAANGRYSAQLRIRQTTTVTASAADGSRLRRTIRARGRLRLHAIRRGARIIITGALAPAVPGAKARVTVAAAGRRLTVRAVTGPRGRLRISVPAAAGRRAAGRPRVTAAVAGIPGVFLGCRARA